jgi:ferredoxin
VLIAEIDQDSCQQAGYCMRVAPTVFRQESDDTVVAGPVAPDQVGVTRDAAQLCPMSAILLSNEEPE